MLLHLSCPDLSKLPRCLTRLLPPERELPGKGLLCTISKSLKEPYRAPWAPGTRQQRGATGVED